MKKINMLRHGLLVLSCLSLLFGCASARKIKVNELESSEFYLNSISFFSFVRGFNINGQEFFSKLPLDEAISAIEKRHGISINQELFSDTENALQQIETTDPSSWTVSSDKKPNQNIKINLMVPANNPNSLEALYYINYTTKEGELKQIESFYRINGWMEKAGIK